MRLSFLAVIPAIALLAACHPVAEGSKHVRVVSISDLDLPYPTAITGTVTSVSSPRLKSTTFTLRDATGEVRVDLDDRAAWRNIRRGDVVTVIGIVDEDDSQRKAHPVVREFDAYEVIPEGGPADRIIPWSISYHNAN